MISRNTTPFCIIQDWRRARLIYNILLCVLKIGLLLLPEKEDAEMRHEWCELVGDVLQRLGIFLECVYELRFELHAGLWDGKGGELLETA